MSEIGYQGIILEEKRVRFYASDEFTKYARDFSNRQLGTRCLWNSAGPSPTRKGILEHLTGEILRPEVSVEDYMEARKNE
jgi:hypothetical protein